MNVNKRSLLQVSLLTFFLSALVLASAPSAVLPQKAGEVSATDKPGLHVVTFDTLNGRVIVHLPDDMAAGDTISGTVWVELKENSDAEGQRSGSEMSGNVLEWTTEAADNKASTPGKVLGRLNLSTFGEYHFKIDLPSRRTGLQPLNYPLKTILTNKDGVQFSKDYFVFADFYRPKLHLPTIGQQGRAVEISGPFDGNFDNTTLKLGGHEVTLLAESPRKLVFQSPADLTGPIEIQLDEAGVQTQSTYHNLGVRLSAPKTNLLKGETTTVTVRVVGLQGIKADVPLHLEKTGVVNMEGGDKQTLKITLLAIQPDGSFTTDRTLTGQEAGIFNVTANVVIFDKCLQDDSVSSRVIRWNSSTGDFVFCPGSGRAGANPVSVSSMNLSGDMAAENNFLKISKQQNLTYADFNNSSARIHAEVDSLMYAASATVQTTNPKTTFTIKDRDVTNNTCACN